MRHLLGAAVQVYRRPPALPGLIRDARDISSNDDDEFDDRLDEALRELTSLSLITFNKRNKTYSMHPIVHTWARERPRLFKLADQCLWANVAGMLISASILLPLPPVKTTTEVDEYLVSLLAHIEQVQAFHHTLKEKLEKQPRPFWRKLRLVVIPRAKDANESGCLSSLYLPKAGGGQTERVCWSRPQMSCTRLSVQSKRNPGRLPLSSPMFTSGWDGLPRQSSSNKEFCIAATSTWGQNTRTLYKRETD